MTIFNNFNTSSTYKLISDKLIKRYLSLVLWLYGIENKKPFSDLLETIFTWRSACGWEWTIHRLKYVHVKTLQSLAKQPGVHVPNNEQRLALSRDGLPKCIPHSIRTQVREGNAKIIQALLSLLTVYRVIPIKGKLKLSTIVKPFSGLSTTLQMQRLQYVFSLFPKVILRKPKGLDDLLPLRTAGPNGKPSIMSAPLDAKALTATNASNLLYSLQSLSLYFDSGLHRLLNKEINLVKSWPLTKTDLKIGKLAFKPEPAGKVRVFAMLDV